MRTTFGATRAGDQLITAGCTSCGHTFSALTDDQEATVHHRCPTQASGPTWVLVEPSGQLPTVQRPAGTRLKSASR